VVRVPRTQPSITTVLGQVDPADLGTTMAHEHLVCTASEAQTLTADDVLTDLRLVRDAGARTIVELTPGHLGRDVRALADLSRTTGLHVVCATGYYQESHYPKPLGAQTIDDIEAFLVGELVDGIEGTAIRAGVIGEIGTSVDRITAGEEKVFRAAARASLSTGAPISTHTGLGTMGREQVDLLVSEGLPLERVAVGHLDLVPEPDYHEAIARRGAFIQYDTFGKTAYQDDAARLDCVVEMVRRGFGDHVLLSCDISRPAYLEHRGGWGYVHLLRTIVPRLRDRIGEAAVRRMLVDNPARFLAVPRTADRQPEGVA
jgi:phosphotriesterase-related protein